MPDTPREKTLRKVAQEEPNLWRSLKVEAARRDVTLKEMIRDILVGWLERQRKKG
ncbi:MAG: hypothetical protein Q8P22_05820 [Chloroflexota bacterium]|nr:hypothetical protein [Chloroflexota bacterium]